YVYLGMTQPESISFIGLVVTAEKFGFGFGAVGDMIYMMQQLAPGKYKTSHYAIRSEEHTSELQSRENLVCRLLLEKKKTNISVQPSTSSFICPPERLPASSLQTWPSLR